MVDALLSRALLKGKIFHARHTPKHHAFSYGGYYLMLPLNGLDALKSLRIFSRNRFNLFSMRDTDYGFGDAHRFENWLPDILAEYGLRAGISRIELVTLPRIFGYAFNPVSFWCCFDTEQNLRAVMAEVSNTFGERHSYLCFHDDSRPITPNDWLFSDKKFHVSPFFEIKGHYAFRFVLGQEKTGIFIDYYEGETKLLSTSLTGTRHALTDASLLHCFFRYPLMTIKVITLIHYHALRLILKGIRYRRKPAPPVTEISR